MILRVEYLIDPVDPASVCWTHYSFLPGVENALDLGRDALAEVHAIFGARGFRVVDEEGRLLARACDDAGPRHSRHRMRNRRRPTVS